ncbi:MAG: ATP-binding protein [Desulfosporosinus sp.]|nr:ATP-binding protein [Desulfosporosinus sp.]
MILFRERLLWKLLLTNVVPVIASIMLVIWLTVDQLAASYFMALMKKYEISPTDIHRMFLSSIHYSLIWASLAALVLAFILSYLLTRRVLKPLSQMNAITRDVAEGNFKVRVEVTTKDEVGQLGFSFNRMADSLERIEQLRKNMVADVAHELRTPLTNLRGYLEALNDQVISPSPETLKLLEKETLRLVKLVDNLQQLARAEAARHHLERENLLISEQIGALFRLYLPVLQEKNIAISSDFPEEADRVQADRDKFLQAVRNLLDNSVKYTPQGGTLSISSRRCEKGTEVCFCNTGPEIPNEDLLLIFERFFRTDRSRSRDAGGAGIGLAITKELIEAHGGRVGAKSSDGQTCIWFTLPDGKDCLN